MRTFIVREGRRIPAIVISVSLNRKSSVLRPDDGAWNAYFDAMSRQDAARKKLAASPQVSMTPRPIATSIPSPDRKVDETRQRTRDALEALRAHYERPAVSVQTDAPVRRCTEPRLTIPGTKSLARPTGAGTLLRDTFDSYRPKKAQKKQTPRPSLKAASREARRKAKAAKAERRRQRQNQSELAATT